MGMPNCACIPPDGDDWSVAWLRECDFHKAQREAMERARGALADIHTSADMTLRLARKKAGRIYVETDLRGVPCIGVVINEQISNKSERC